jgi:hypothetical protein
MAAAFRCDRGKMGGRLTTTRTGLVRAASFRI